MIDKGIWKINGSGDETKVLIFLIICVIIGCYCLNDLNYKRGNYYKSTRQPYLKVCFNIGLNGEYLTYKNLEEYECKGAKFLFNCYLPKKDGETTEIDLLLISESGIFVFESKNYSGWIFGSEDSKTWMQTLPQGKGRRAHKEKFLNPILQNKLHIKCLRDILKRKIPIHSVIVFSDRCTLKKVDIHSSDVFVVKRLYIKSVVDKINSSYYNRLSPGEIEEIYQLLYPYTQVSDKIKEEHVNAIQKRLPGRELYTNNIKIPDRIVPEQIGGNLCQQSSRMERNDNLIGKKDKVIPFGMKTLFLCPKCGGNLILRTAGKGKNKGKMFYGCSNFPKCRYIQSLDK